MKDTLYTLLILLLTITSCSPKNDFTLKGEISGLSSDTLLLLYQIPDLKVDTLISEKGKFEYSFMPDTFTIFSLIFNTQEQIPIYAEKGQTVSIKGSFPNLEIKGEGENKLMNEILSLLKGKSGNEAKQKADSLIQSNTDSYTNLYLIEKYYVNEEEPDYAHLNKLIQKQSGKIKDTSYIISLQTKLDNTERKGNNESVYSFYSQGRNGKAIKWTNIRNNYILMDFWASWHARSVAEQDSLENVLKELKKENFLIYSISLDVDKEKWLEASNRDTTQWYQVCDFKGWNNSFLKKHNIHTLPSNLLLDKNKRIIARNIRGKELIEKVKQLIQQDKQKEEKRKKR